MSSVSASASSKHNCPSCRRGYKSKIYYNRHVAVCELMCKSMKERQLENEENDDTPTIRVLYDVILELTNKMEKMERKIHELSKMADLKKKKINMVDWLNENKCRETDGKQLDLEELILNIKVNRIHLENLFQTDYTSGILNVLQDLLPLDTESSNAIKAFDNKLNVLFTFSDSK